MSTLDRPGTWDVTGTIARGAADAVTSRARASLGLVDVHLVHPDHQHPKTSGQKR